MKGSSGISLIEILVSLLILALAVGPFVGMFIQSSRINKGVKDQLDIIYMVRNEMEILMAQNSSQVYMADGIKDVDGTLIRTTVEPYHPKPNLRYFNIIIKSLIGGDKISVYTPDDYRSFFLEGDNEAWAIDIDIATSYFNIAVNNECIAGYTNSIGEPYMEINFVGKNSFNHLDFNIEGDLKIGIYPGEDDNWDINFDNDYTVMDKFLYRDYSMFKIKIEAFKEPALHKPTFKIENIIRVPN